MSRAPDFEEMVTPMADVDSLVSVRDLDEFDLVTHAGVSIVDLKDPSLGPLSPTSEKIWELVEKRSHNHASLNAGNESRSSVLLSAALGERNEAVAAARLLPRCFQFAKAGPSDCSDRFQLDALWKELRISLHSETELVAVAYADWQLANAMKPMEILRLAVDQGLDRFLIDTFTKDGRSLIDFVGLEELGRLQRFAADHQLWFAMAGSINQSEVERLDQARVWPDCYAVRGAVCGCEGRSSAISRDRLIQWQDFLRTRGAGMGADRLN